MTRPWVAAWLVAALAAGTAAAQAPDETGTDTAADDGAAADDGTEEGPADETPDPADARTPEQLAMMEGALPPGVDPEALVGGGAGFDVARERLRLEYELETVQMNGAWFFGGGFATLAGLGGVGGSAAWLAGENGDVGGPVAALVSFAVVGVVGIVLVALGIVDALDVQARRQVLEARRDALGATTTGMFRIGLGSGGELRIR